MNKQDPTQISKPNAKLKSKLKKRGEGGEEGNGDMLERNISMRSIEHETQNKKQVPDKKIKTSKLSQHHIFSSECGILHIYL